LVHVEKARSIEDLESNSLELSDVDIKLPKQIRLVVCSPVGLESLIQLGVSHVPIGALAVDKTFCLRARATNHKGNLTILFFFVHIRFRNYHLHRATRATNFLVVRASKGIQSWGFKEDI
jgi:hypothetical protein